MLLVLPMALKFVQSYAKVTLIPYEMHIPVNSTLSKEIL